MKERSPYGSMVLELRQINGISLNAMAKKLKVTESYLAQLERGYKKVPDEMLDKVSNYFKLNDQAKEQLKDAIIISNGMLEIPLDGLSEEKLMFLLSLSKNIADLDDSKVEKLLEVLKS